MSRMDNDSLRIPGRTGAAEGIYADMLSSLPVPERLSPENIARMLEENSSYAKRRASLAKSADSREESVSEKKKGRRAGLSVAYRAVCAVAACAVLSLGVVRYMDMGGAALADNPVRGSSYADNYDELHKTFRKYYVDDSSKTLDAVMAEIEHSYNQTDSSTVSDSQSANEEPPRSEQNGVSPSVQPDADSPAGDISSQQDEGSAADESAGVRLPQLSGEESADNVIIQGTRLYVINGSSVKVIESVGGTMSYIGECAPQDGIYEKRTLERVFPIGDRLCVIYSVVSEEPVSVPAAEQSMVDILMGGLYPEQKAEPAYSVEIVVYEQQLSGGFVASLVTSQSGTLIDARESGGYVYVVTDYDYDHSPIIGVEDLDSYVPSYTINGYKSYILPENILIPQRVSTTDYTVISGVAVLEQGTPVFVQAVLGSEGKVVMTDSSVYVFGYSEADGLSSTVCECLDLGFGAAGFVGSASVSGVALPGGIFEDNGTLFIVTLESQETGLVTSVNALRKGALGMELVSKVSFPGAASYVSYDNGIVDISGSESYSADFSDPYSPTVTDYAHAVDITSGLLSYGDGYITLTEEDGAIYLQKISISENGLVLDFETVVNDSSPFSKALSDNSLIYTDEQNGLVGVPYGFFDGHDYCYRYQLYRLDGNVFSPAGSVETHEVDDDFEIFRAKLSGGILYVISDGRIYACAVGEDSMSVISSVDLIQSSYSGHSNW